MDPELLLEGDTPRLIDEWQLAPQLWDAVRFSVDHRDNDGLECDAVIHLRNGHYGLVEIKLGGDSLVEDGAKTLLSLARKIDCTRMPVPSFMRDGKICLPP